MVKLEYDCSLRCTSITRFEFAWTNVFSLALVWVFDWKCRFMSGDENATSSLQQEIEFIRDSTRFKQCPWSVARHLNANEFVQFHTRVTLFFSGVSIKIKLRDFRFPKDFIFRMCKAMKYIQTYCLRTCIAVRVQQCAHSRVWIWIHAASIPNWAVVVSLEAINTYFNGE